jgi:hypothetical protein
VRDVEQQLAGIDTKDDLEVVHDTLLPAQKELVDAILAHPGLTLEAEICWRNRAIQAVTEYCGVEEGAMYASQPKRSRGHITPPSKSEDASQLNPDKEALEAAKVSVYKETRPRICFVCLGNENLPTKLRTCSFHTSGDLSKHFKRKHLANTGKGHSLRCNLCQVDLDNKMHWQQHAFDIHGTVL